MSLKYSGSEKGLRLTPKGIDHYADLLGKSYILLSSDQKEDPSTTTFSIADRQDLLDGNGSVNLCLDQEALTSLRDKQLTLCVLAKESSSRSCNVIYNASIDANSFSHNVPLAADSFKGFAFNSSIFIDALIYEVSPLYGYIIQGFKRFSLSFSAIAGLWSIEAREPDFFVKRGGGVETLFLTEVTQDEDDLVSRPAFEVVKVYINNTCVREFERLTNKADTAGDVLRRFFVHSVLLKISQQLFKSFESYPGQCDDGSVASKVLEILDIQSEVDYESLAQQSKYDPEQLSLRIQNRLSLSGTVSKFTGGK